jgi:elongation factor 1-alpha
VVLRRGAQINNGDTAIVYIHTAQVECTLEPLRKLDRRTRKTIEEYPSVLNENDFADVKITPSEPICVERFSDCAALGRVVVRGLDRNLAVGVVVGFEN